MTKVKPTRLLFLENRGITDIWSRVAGVLQADADCQLLRFNRAYGDEFPGPIIDLTAPSRTGTALEPYVETLLETLYVTDRAAYLYGAAKPTIRCAAVSVLQALDSMSFDAVVGEVTSIYERVVDAYCRARNIPFLAPMTARIPPDRFFFLEGSAAYPLPISPMPGRTAEGGAAAQAARQYAGRNDLAKATRVNARLRSLLLSFWGWLAGERLHTPSPWRRAMLTWARYRARSKLAKCKLAHLTAVGPDAVVYCMHVQPESTLETYSPEHCNQGAVMQALAAACETAQRPFLVRPHPRGRDEMHLYLEKIIGKQAILSPRVAMAELLAIRPTIVTVTGTVLIEAATAGVPAVALGRSYLSSFPGVLEVAIEEFDKVLAGECVARPATAAAQREWFDAMARFTHAGVIAPPEWGPEPLSDANIGHIADAIRSAIQWLQSNMPKS